MKVNIDRKLLVSNLKTLKSLSAKSSEDIFKDIVVLTVQENGLSVSCTTGTAFISVLLVSDVKTTGTCHVSFKLYDLLKAVRGDTITLSFQKSLVISSTDGFRATLPENVSRQIPIDMIKEKISGGVETELTLKTEAVINLSDISNVFPPLSSIRWMDIVSNGEEIYGTVQGSEYGTLDKLPMEGHGDVHEYTMRPDHVASILSFCGEHVRLATLKDTKGVYLLTDPEDDSWWAAVMHVIKPNSVQE